MTDSPKEEAAKPAPRMMCAKDGRIHEYDSMCVVCKCTEVTTEKPVAAQPAQPSISQGVVVPASPGFYLAYKPGRAIADTICWPTRRQAQEALNEKGKHVNPPRDFNDFLHVVEVQQQFGGGHVPMAQPAQPRDRPVRNAILAALWNLCRENFYNAANKLPNNEELNRDVKWWLLQASEFREYDKPDRELLTLASQASSSQQPAPTPTRMTAEE